jgi:hypothetical protein
LTLGLFVTALCAPLTALAQQNPNCPPGAWFCEETPVERAPDAAPERPKTPPPDADEPSGDTPLPPQRRRPLPPPGAKPPPPPVVVYQPVPTAPPAHVVIVAPGYGLVRPIPPPPPPPPAPRPMWRPEWGINMRVEGLALGQRASSSAGMGGLGMSLRYRPVPAFALDLGADLIGGIDYNGFQRLETPVSLSGLLYVNPRSRVQFYLTGGIDWSHARVTSDAYSPLLRTQSDSSYGADYNYLGGHGGLGLEFRLSKHVAMNIDMIGFMRSRIDGRADTPEFVDYYTGRTSNTSGGGLFRGGLTIWW